MTWQTTATCLMIGGACVYLTQRFLLAMRGTKTGCSGGCGCAKPSTQANEPALIPPESLTIRR